MSHREGTPPASPSAAGRRRPTLARDDCAEIERALLTLARFTGGRRHHRRTVGLTGAGRVETVTERRERDELARARREREPFPPWLSFDPDALATPVLLPAAAQVEAGLYPILAVVEDLFRPRPIDIAQVLTLDRSTVARHLDTLEKRRLIYRERGFSIRRRPRIRLTVQGFNAMKQVRQARISRLEVAVKTWPQLERRLVVLCLQRLAQALHDEVESVALPDVLSDATQRRMGSLPARAPLGEPHGAT
ncbi:MAG: MarR family winged helix-turn-helix transcriptional regulator [Thermoleophilia bacterium]